jgi:hypothetical protein
MLWVGGAAPGASRLPRSFLWLFGEKLKQTGSLFAFEPQAKGSEQVIQVFPETLWQDEEAVSP